MKLVTLKTLKGANRTQSMLRTSETFHAMLRSLFGICVNRPGQ